MIRDILSRKCPFCGDEYLPRSSLQKTCSNYRCITDNARQKAKDKREKDERKAAKISAADALIKYQKQKPWSELNSEAQKAFNRYIRIRDEGKDCHSCGCLLRVKGEYLTGAAIDASHYRSRGAASHLRFNVFNCVVCCTKCNRELSGNIRNLRIGLMIRFGVAIVDQLDASNAPDRFSAEYLIRIKHVFSRRAKHLQLLRDRISGE